MTERLTADERAKAFEWAEHHGWYTQANNGHLGARLLLELRDELNEERETKQQLGDAYRAAQRERDAAIERRDAALDETMAAEAETSDMQEQRDAALARVESLDELLSEVEGCAEQEVQGCESCNRILKKMRAALASPDGTTEGE